MKKQYAACYNNVIYPTSGQCLWERTGYGDLQPPPIRRKYKRRKGTKREGNRRKITLN